MEVRLTLTLASHILYFSLHKVYVETATSWPFCS